MNYGKVANGVSSGPMTIKTSWITAAQDAYKSQSFDNVIKFAVTGDAACENDSLQSYSTPGGNPFYSSTQVWP